MNRLTFLKSLCLLPLAPLAKKLPDPPARPSRFLWFVDREDIIPSNQIDALAGASPRFIQTKRTVFYPYPSDAGCTLTRATIQGLTPEDICALANAEARFLGT